MVALMNLLLDVAGDDEDHPLSSLLELAGDLVSRYEQEYHAIEPVNPRDTLRFLMEAPQPEARRSFSHRCPEQSLIDSGGKTKDQCHPGGQTGQVFRHQPGRVRTGVIEFTGRRGQLRAAQPPRRSLWHIAGVWGEITDRKFNRLGPRHRTGGWWMENRFLCPKAGFGSLLVGDNYLDRTRPAALRFNCSSPTWSTSPSPSLRSTTRRSSRPGWSKWSSC